MAALGAELELLPPQQSGGGGCRVGIGVELDGAHAVEAGFGGGVGEQRAGDAAAAVRGGDVEGLDAQRCAAGGGAQARVGISWMDK